MSSRSFVPRRDRPYPGHGRGGLPCSLAPLASKGMDVRPLTMEGVAAATETIARAFLHDPVWGVALGVNGASDDFLLPYWRTYVEGARRYDTAFASEAAGTVSIWIPPGGTELADDQEVELRELVTRARSGASKGALRALEPVRRTSSPPGAPRLPEPPGDTTDPGWAGLRSGAPRGRSCSMGRTRDSDLPRVQQPEQRSPLRAAGIRQGRSVRDGPGPGDRGDHVASRGRLTGASAGGRSGRMLR